MLEYPDKTEGAASPSQRDGVSHPRFSAPRTLAELERVLRPDGTLLAVGSDLALLLRKQLRELDNVVYLGNVCELKSSPARAQHAEIRTAVTYEEALVASRAL